jgi:hypothetical protein
MSWSNDSAFDAADWDMVREAVADAARAVNELQLLEASMAETMVSEGQSNAVNGAFHAAIVRALRLRGGRRPSSGDHDLELFGLPIEIKTSGTGAIKTNRSYASQGHGRRLLIAVNFRLSRFRGQAKIEPYLIRWGSIGPEHYKASGAKGQLAEMLPAGYARLFALWSLPLASFPAELTPGLGPKGLAKLGNPVSVGMAKAVMAGSNERTLTAQAAGLDLSRVALASHWLTYGQKAPALAKHSLLP